MAWSEKRKAGMPGVSQVPVPSSSGYWKKGVKPSQEWIKFTVGFDKDSAKTKKSHTDCSA